MNDDWLPMQFRDFWDIPRIVVVSYRGQTYMFDCPFDRELDDYPDHFVVYRISRTVPAADSGESWEQLTEGAHVVGRIATNDVRFDPSRRLSIHASSLIRILESSG